MNPESLLQGVRDGVSVRRVFGDPIERSRSSRKPAFSIRAIDRL